MVGEFKVLQSNYGAEHAKGPITIDVISKAGGRDFHGMAIYLRDYRWNSNEWRSTSQHRARRREQAPEKDAYPGFNLGGPLIIPGTGFNKDRNKVFFFTGYEFYKQRLDTGILQSWVPTDAMLNGDLSHVVVLGPQQLVRQHRAVEPGERPDSGQPDRPNASHSCAAASAERRPGPDRGYNYVESVELDQNMQQRLTRVDVNVSDNTRIFAATTCRPRRRTSRSACGGATPTRCRTRRRDGANRSHSTTASLTHVFGPPSLTSESTFGLTFIDFPNQLEDPSRVSRSALGHQPRHLQSGLDQIPSMTGWGNGPTMFNPGGFDPSCSPRSG